MKTTILTASLLIILSSCQKEFTKPDKSATIPASELSYSNASPIISAPPYHQEQKWDYTAFDSCTMENILIHHDETVDLWQFSRGDTVFYNYRLSVAGTTGEGLLSGRKYIGMGGVREIFRSSVTKDGVPFLNEEIINRISFVTEGRNNDLTSEAYYKIVTDQFGNIVIKKEFTHFQFCK